MVPVKTLKLHCLASVQWWIVRCVSRVLSERVLKLIKSTSGRFQDFLQHSDSLQTCQFSPSGTLLFSVAYNEILLWEVRGLWPDLCRLIIFHLGFMFFFYVTLLFLRSFHQLNSFGRTGVVCGRFVGRFVTWVFDWIIFYMYVFEI